MMSAMMICGFSQVDAHAADNHNWYTYYNDDNINQLVSSCSMVYYYAQYKATVTSVSGSAVDKITPQNGTQFRDVGSVSVSSSVRTATVFVCGASSTGNAQFIVRMYNYNDGALIYGNIYKN